MEFVLTTLIIAWLPGAVTWYLLQYALPLARPATVNKQRSEARFPAERPLWASLFLCTATGLIIVGWLGLILAQLGRFRPTMVLATLAGYTAACLGLLAWRHSRQAGPPGIPKDENSPAIQSCHSERSEESPYASPETLRSAQGDRCGDGSYFRNRSPWETIVAAVLFVGALWFYSSLPAEYLPAFFDPGWYFNTGALVARTGALTFESRPFSALPPDLRPPFFSSFRALRFDFPQLPESGSRGFFLTAFAVPDVDDGIITPYHPPLLSIWLALFYTFGGVQAALRVPALFGALSVLAMLLAGRALFGRGAGLLAALLLAVSLPQVYFSRTPYAEVLVQFFVLVGLYALTAFARRASPAHGVLAGLAFGQALLTKIESVLIVIPLAVFWATWLARRRDGLRTFLVFGLPFTAAAGHALLLAATVNRVYVALNGYGVWSRWGAMLTQPLLWLASAVAGVVAMLWLVLHGRSWRGLLGRHWFAQAPSPAMRRALAWTILLLATYGYFVQPLVSSIMSGGLKASGTPSLVQSGRFLSPWGVWLGLVGLVLLVDRGFVWRHGFFAALVLTTCTIVLAAPTISTAVSPLYAVRRQVPIVIPAFLLLASYALLSGWQLISGFLGRSTVVTRYRTATTLAPALKRSHLSPAWLVQGLAILVLMAGLVGIARPYLRYREMRGTADFVERLASQFPPGALVLFEAVDADSHVGRFAAPLWAMYGINALLLSPSAPLSEVGQALAFWRPLYGTLYWVSASPRPPMLVSGYRFDLVDDELWESSAISPNPTYPPKIEYLEVPFYIYEIIPEA